MNGLEDEKALLDLTRFVPRTWFFGTFMAILVFGITQVALLGAILSNDHSHEDGGFTGGFTFELNNQEWATGPKGARPPGFEGVSWAQILEKARGTTVTFGADADHMGVNYVPFLTKALKDKFDISLSFINKKTPELVTEGTADGNIDFIWMNKINFIELRSKSNTYGPYAPYLPNAVFFDFKDPVISTDFGIPTNGEEMPLHIANFVMAYNPENIPTNIPEGTEFPPRNIRQLVEQVNSGSVQFHPVDPATWVGTPFLEMFFYEYVGYDNIERFAQPFNEEWWIEQRDIVFKVLKEFHKNLYVNENAKYGNHTAARDLFKNGKTHLSSEYAPGAVFNNVEKGIYPKTTRSHIFDTGMVSNTNFLTMLKNAPNKEAAFVAINLASSLEHQYKRFIPNEGSWKALQAYSPFKSIVQNTGYVTVFDEIEQLEGAPTIEAMAANRVPEMNQVYFERMVADFNLMIGVGEVAKP